MAINLVAGTLLSFAFAINFVSAVRGLARCTQCDPTLNRRDFMGKQLVIVFQPTNYYYYYY